MFQKVLEYAGEYRKTTYLSMVVMLIGIVMNMLPFLFIYQLIRPIHVPRLDQFLIGHDRGVLIPPGMGHLV